VALPALLALIIFAPTVVFSAVIAVLAFWGLFEIGEMVGARGWCWVLLALAGGVPSIAPILRGQPLSAGWVPCLIVFSLMMMLVGQVAMGGLDNAPNGALLALLGAVWVGMFFPYFALLHNGISGIRLVILMVLLVFASDSGAYFAGRLAGRIKLMPQVSPHKTVEGALGGLAASVAVAVILRHLLLPQASPGAVAILALAVAILAQAGDLANSAFKRVAGVKDSGWIFPGHGGLLDRTCSLVFPAVLTYYFLPLMRLGRGL
jgi:phosphatidate cytidylyltransferase